MNCSIKIKNKLKSFFTEHWKYKTVICQSYERTPLNILHFMKMSDLTLNKKKLNEL